MLKPVGHNILVQRILKEQKSKSGIILPEQSSPTLMHTGTVLAIGSQVDPELGIKEGDRIVFNKYAIDEISKEEILVEDRDVVGIETE